MGGSPESASFGPDGSRILTVDDGVAVGGRRPRRRGASPAGSRQASVFGPGGARVVTIGASAARVFDVRTGAVLAVDHGGGMARAIDWRARSTS